MAECSYARCVQQRRNIRRELQRWTKNMVHIVGLERIAEELMGRRKWKLYQESMSRSYLQPLNNNIKRTNPPDDECIKDPKYPHQQTLSSSEPDLDGIESKQPSCREPTATTPQPAAARTPQNAARETNGDAGGGGGGPEEIRGEHQKENEKTTAPGVGTPSGQQQRDEGAAGDGLRDWKPQDKCYFCVDGKLDSEHASHGVLSPRPSDSDTSDSHSDGEVPASLTPSSRGLLNNNHHHNRSSVQHAATPSAMTTIENVSMAALAVAALSGGGGSPAAPAGPYLPAFYNHSVLTRNWCLANVARSLQNAAASAAASSEADKAGGGEQPLDLSKGASSASANNFHEPKAGLGNNANVRLPTLDTKHIFKAKPRMSAVAGRRTYTEDELQAALRDIQSGKLGTRRAAVIYGIPRSTLRNKVYKLAMERERESHLNSSSSLKLDEDEAMDDDKELSGAEEEKEVEKALQAPLISISDLLMFTSREQQQQHPEALKALLQRGKEAGDPWAGMDHSEVGPYIQNILFASQKQQEGLPDFVKRMMTENSNGDVEQAGPSPSGSMEVEADLDGPSNVILKIPSFRPTNAAAAKNGGCDQLFGRLVEPTSSGGSMVSPQATTSESGSPPVQVLPSPAAAKGIMIKDVKDVIAQSISQKFQQTMEQPRRPPMIDMDPRRGGYTPPLGSAGISVIKTQQDVGRQYQQQPKPQQNMSVGSAPAGGKGTRPKRGKYRNYDRDSLVEAVRAVQRGEMSVHRAGSYYGVPHSTLEYKVKERHLMRPRKRDPKPNPVDEKIASLKQNDIRISQEKLAKPSMKPPSPQKFPSAPPNGMKLQLFEPIAGYNHPPFPFWPHPGFPHIPLDYASRNPASPFSAPNAEFFASQMMQKLQEESARTLGAAQTSAPALAKNARQVAESLLESGAGSNGSFLDGIIRSSLESGVPGNEEKSPKEEKNLAPENMSNKALLDQLCRNSRLTPLSRQAAIAEANSSGDESYRKSPLNFAAAGNQHEDNNDEDSLPRHETDMHTIELSNDSNSSGSPRTAASDEERQQTVSGPRVYLRKELAKPENLKPEMLVRNGTAEGEKNAPQD